MYVVIEGPADCGNVFGYHKKNLIPPGKFAIVEHGELANGGYGPSLAYDGAIFGSRSDAEEEIARRRCPPPNDPD